MYDKGKVLTGIAIFLVVVLFPVWFSAASGKAGHVPDPVIDTKGDECVESAEYMRVNHMQLLDEWRDLVVREGRRYHHVSSTGEKRFERSLSGTCLDCHRNKATFCDACHDYVGVEPNCWDCHIVPGGE